MQEEKQKRRAVTLAAVVLDFVKHLTRFMDQTTNW